MDKYDKQVFEKRKQLKTYEREKINKLNNKKVKTNIELINVKKKIPVDGVTHFEPEFHNVENVPIETPDAQTLDDLDDDKARANVMLPPQPITKNQKKDLKTAKIIMKKVIEAYLQANLSGQVLEKQLEIQNLDSVDTDSVDNFFNSRVSDLNGIKQDTNISRDFKNSELSFKKELFDYYISKHPDSNFATANKDILKLMLSNKTDISYNEFYEILKKNPKTKTEIEKIIKNLKNKREHYVKKTYQKHKGIIIK